MVLTVQEYESRVVLLLLCCGRKLELRKASALNFKGGGLGRGVVRGRVQWIKGRRIGNSYLRLTATDLLYSDCFREYNDYLYLVRRIVAGL